MTPRKMTHARNGVKNIQKNLEHLSVLRMKDGLKMTTITLTTI